MFLVPVVLREVIPDKPAETQDSGYAELKKGGSNTEERLFSQNESGPVHGSQLIQAATNVFSARKMQAAVQPLKKTLALFS